MFNLNCLLLTIFIWFYYISFILWKAINYWQEADNVVGDRQAIAWQLLLDIYFLYRNPLNLMCFWYTNPLNLMCFLFVSEMCWSSLTMTSHWQSTKCYHEKSSLKHFHSIFKDWHFKNCKKSTGPWVCLACCSEWYDIK